MLKIYSILCRAGSMDNYAYLVVDEKTGISAVIDPSEAKPVVEKCNELKVIPDYIFNTHHHFDHTDGNLSLKKLYKCKIIGSDERIPGLDVKLKDGDIFSLGDSVAEIIDVSFHTQNSILWYFKKDKALFTGDTLFNLSIGGLFEGNEQQMKTALEKIKSLPNDVLFYPGHEYTRYGINDLNPNDVEAQEYIKIAKERLSKGLPVHPIPLGLEKKCNYYLRESF